MGLTALPPRSVSNPARPLIRPNLIKKARPLLLTKNVSVKKCPRTTLMTAAILTTMMITRTTPPPLPLNPTPPGLLIPLPLLTWTTFLIYTVPLARALRHPVPSLLTPLIALLARAAPVFLFNPLPSAPFLNLPFFLSLLLAPAVLIFISALYLPNHILLLTPPLFPSASLRPNDQNSPKCNHMYLLSYFQNLERLIFSSARAYLPPLSLPSQKFHSPTLE